MPNKPHWTAYLRWQTEKLCLEMYPLNLIRVQTIPILGFSVKHKMQKPILPRISSNEIYDNR